MYVLTICAYYHEGDEGKGALKINKVQREEEEEEEDAFVYVLRPL